jgi:hypothetical protein
MDDETLTALRGSIAKWEGIVAGTDVDRGASNCPLCQLFRPQGAYNSPCRGCPVYQDTGLKGCEGTPYDHYNSDGEGAKALAQAEVDYLKSLLPENAG